MPAVVAGAGQAAGAARVGRPVQQRVRVTAPGRRLQRAHVRQVRPQHKRRFPHAQVGIIRIYLNLVKVLFFALNVFKPINFFALDIKFYVL